MTSTENDDYSWLDGPVEPDSETVVVLHDVPSFGIEQEQAGYCYAAVEQILRGTLAGDWVSQDQIAHEFCRRKHAVGLAGAAGGDQYIANYNAAIDRLVADFGVAEDWDSVRVYLEDEQMRNTVEALHHSWGLPNLGLFPGRPGHGLDVDLLCGTIDGGGLIAVMQEIHYQVVYGYRRSVVDGASTCYALVYDPMDKKSAELEPGSFANWDLAYLER